MAFDINGIYAVAPELPPRLVLYGTDGIGKTELATNAPNPVILCTEKGLRNARARRTPHAIITSYPQMMQALSALLTEKHDRQTVVVDTIDWFESMVWAWTALQGGQQDIEGFGYGKGYLAADEYWREFLAMLDRLREERGMMIILLAHDEIVRFDSPSTEPYDRYKIKLHKRAEKLVREWPDIVGFAHWDTYIEKADAGFNKKIARGATTGRRVLALEERPAYHAKNGYGMAPVIDLSWAAFIAEYIAAGAREAAKLAPAVESAEASTETVTVAAESAGAGAGALAAEQFPDYPAEMPAAPTDETHPLDAAA